MTLEGWIKVYRQVRDHWLWEGDRFTRGQAWIDLLLRARHRDREVRIGNQFVTEKRGQVLVSQRQLARQWGWNRETVFNFLRLLKADHMVSLETSHGPEGGYTLITILNYERYQGSDESENEYESGHESSHGSGHDPATNPAIHKNVKNEKKEKTPVFDEGAFWEKFSPQDQETIRQTIGAIHSTRKSGKVAASVIQAEMRWWDQRNPVQLIQGMRTYLQKGYAAQGKREAYLRGIVRNLDGQPPPPLQASPEIGPRGGHPAIRRAALSMTEEDVSG